MLVGSSMDKLPGEVFPQIQEQPQMLECTSFLLWLFLNLWDKSRIPTSASLPTSIPISVHQPALHSLSGEGWSLQGLPICALCVICG